MRRPHRPALLALAAATLGGLVACGGEPVPALPALGIDPQRVAVAGLSSGAFMATQVHVALNSRIHGAALVAGGPYGCAAGSLETALGPCMVAAPQLPDGGALAARATAEASRGRIDPLAGFDDDRVLVLHGAKDTTVAPALAQVTAAFYRATAGRRLATLVVDDARAFGHGLPVAGAGAPCEAPASPWLLDCGFDAAGRIVDVLFPTASEGGEGTAAPAEPGTAGGQLLRFDQTGLAPKGAEGLAGTGYLYVPTACADGGCGALVVFHGCQQDAESVGEAFVREAGFNRWADARGLVVVYPQARSSYVPLNPKACWDWWGYGGADYDTREGGQVRFVAALLDRLGEAR